MYVNRRLLRTKFLPLFVQRRCPARSRKVWGHGAVSRSDGLCKIQGTIWRKLSAVRTLRSASFKRKNNTWQLYSQQQKTNFGRLNNYIRFYLWKRKIPPTQRSDDFVGWIGGKMNRVCCGAVNSSWTFPHGSGGSHGDNQPLSVAVFKMNTTTSCSFRKKYAMWIRTNPIFCLR